jgi:hypothetical protein
MSLDVYLIDPNDPEGEELYWRNITHNLGKMAAAADVYKALWRPEEIKAKQAKDIIQPLTDGLQRLQEDPERYRQLNPDNGWGTYEGLVSFVQEYLKACTESPGATIRVSR